MFVISYVTWGLPVECSIGRDAAIILVDCEGAGDMIREWPQARSPSSVAIGQRRRCRRHVVVAAQNRFPPNLTLHGAAKGVEWRVTETSDNTGEEKTWCCKPVKGGSTCLPML